MRICVLALFCAVSLSAAGFPADTLLPSRWVQHFADSGFDYDSASFAYARDSQDRLYATRIITEKSGYLSTTVAITDRQGRYLGGSYQKRTAPPIAIEAEYGAQGRLVREVYRSEGTVYNEDYGYDDRGGLIGQTMRDGQGRITKQTLWANSYDSAGRLLMSIESHPLDGLPDWASKRFFDASGRVSYRLDWAGSADSVDFWDSTAYLYAPDGRLLEEREFKSGGKPFMTVEWEYSIWQVPLSLAFRPERDAARSPSGSAFPGLRDALGRAASRRPRLPAFPDHP